MRIARPQSGFELTISKRVEEQLQLATKSYPDLRMIFDNACARLRFTAHREGVEVEEHGRVVVEFDPLTGAGRLAITYTVLGDQLRIVSLKTLSQ